MRLRAAAREEGVPALDWTAYRERLAEQGPRWEVLGVNFYRAPEIDWR